MKRATQLRVVTVGWVVGHVQSVTAVGVAAGRRRLIKSVHFRADVKVDKLGKFC
ncbi:MAG: hypothetical protein V3U29_08335 [Phycisphaeraceae bacterium]